MEYWEIIQGGIQGDNIKRDTGIYYNVEYREIIQGEIQGDNIWRDTGR